jgi:hypothetical protein
MTARSTLSELGDPLQAHLGFALRSQRTCLQSLTVSRPPPSPPIRLMRTMDLPERPNIPRCSNFRRERLRPTTQMVSTEHSYSGSGLISAPTLVSQKLKARGLIPDISKLSKRGDASQKESTTSHENADSKQL